MNDKNINDSNITPKKRLSLHHCRCNTQKPPTPRQMEPSIKSGTCFAPKNADRTNLESSIHLYRGYSITQSNGSSLHIDENRNSHGAKQSNAIVNYAVGTVTGCNTNYKVSCGKMITSIRYCTKLRRSVFKLIQIEVEIGLIIYGSLLYNG